MSQINKILKSVALIIYYSLGTKFPTGPAPTSHFGYRLKQILLGLIAAECGKDILVKHGCYFGTGNGLKVEEI